MPGMQIQKATSLETPTSTPRTSPRSTSCRTSSRATRAILNSRTRSSAKRVTSLWSSPCKTRPTPTPPDENPTQISSPTIPTTPLMKRTGNQTRTSFVVGDTTGCQPPVGHSSAERRGQLALRHVSAAGRTAPGPNLAFSSSIMSSARSQFSRARSKLICPPAVPAATNRSAVRVTPRMRSRCKPQPVLPGWREVAIPLERNGVARSSDPSGPLCELSEVVAA
jgi:hypothetical protein